jgi:hypothetical protein
MLQSQFAAQSENVYLYSLNVHCIEKKVKHMSKFLKMCTFYFLCRYFAWSICGESDTILIGSHERRDYVDICFRMTSEFTQLPN